MFWEHFWSREHWLGNIGLVAGTISKIELGSKIKFLASLIMFKIFRYIVETQNATGHKTK
jgi:hypothetical protein